MKLLDVCLIILTVFFWAGMFVYYFRVQIYRWVDRNIKHEPLTDRLRGLVKQGRK